MNLNREEFIKPNITDYFNYIKDQSLQNEEAPNWEKIYVTHRCDQCKFSE